MKMPQRLKDSKKHEELKIEKMDLVSHSVLVPLWRKG